MSRVARHSGNLAQTVAPAKNTLDAFGAEASLELDDADDLVFNEIIWKAVKGKDSPMPPPVRSAYVLPRHKPEKD